MSGILHVSKFLCILTFVSTGVDLFASVARTTPSNDSIPSCVSGMLFDSRNFKISQYGFGVPIMFQQDIGYFNWGPTSSNFAIVNNPLESGRPTLVAYDTANYLVYGRPDTEAGWFPSVRTDVQMAPGYKTVAAYDDQVYLLQSPALYRYRPGGELIPLRSDVEPRVSQQVVDADHNFIYLSDSPVGGTWDADAVVVVDSTGFIRYRFEFTPPLNTYNVQSLFMVRDSLFFISGSLNQTFGRALVHIELDYDDYTATPFWISSAGDLTHIFSCSPGKLVAGCEPNVNIPPGTTGTTGPVENTLRLFPNPVQDELWLQGDLRVPVQFDIFSARGTPIKCGLIEGWPGRIDIGGVAPGFYFVQLRSRDDAGKIVTEKFLKIH